MQRMKNILRLLAFFTSAFALQACSNTYSAKAIEAWVVDAETKKPLEGVIVVAHWELRYGLEGGGAYQLHVMETVTDKDGRFYFPEWGPKKIPEHLPKEARLKTKDPGLGIYYPKYNAVTLENERSMKLIGGHGDSTRTSDWNGKTIGMKPSGSGVRIGENIFIDGNRENVVFIRSLQSALHFVGNHRGGCEWVQIPRMVAAQINERTRLQKSGNRELSDAWELHTFEREYQCGSAAEILKAYLK